MWADKSFCLGSVEAVTTEGATRARAALKAIDGREGFELACVLEAGEGAVAYECFAQRVDALGIVGEPVVLVVAVPVVGQIVVVEAASADQGQCSALKVVNAAVRAKGERRT